MNRVSSGQDAVDGHSISNRGSRHHVTRDTKEPQAGGEALCAASTRVQTKQTEEVQAVQ